MKPKVAMGFDNFHSTFIITKYKNEIVLVEVKATTGNTKSTNTILDNYDNYKVNKCIKLGEYNIGEVDNKLTMPYYLVFLLNE